MALSIRLLIASGMLLSGAVTSELSRRHFDAVSSGSSELLRPLHAFPSQIGAWIGTDEPADPKMIADIKIDQYLQRRYTHPSGAQVIVWMSYSQRSLDQYHYPTVCMQGIGWTEEEHRRELHGQPGSLAEPERMRMYFARDGAVQSIHYWYYLLGEGPLDRWMRTLSQTSRAFLRGRRNGSLTVEVFSQSADPDDALIGALTSEIARLLTQWVPPGSEADCALGAAY